MNRGQAIRRCANRCFFCFVDGLPEGLRQSLYVKDDDLLHSFLFGNFVTLTNLREADWHRLESRRLSPLFVSVHATDRELRRRILGNPEAPDIMEQLRRLGQLRIQIHAQVVLCSGVNDGDHLSETVADLSSLHPTVQSVAVVPVGITKHTIARKGNAMVRPSPEEAAKIIGQLAGFQRRFRRERQNSFVYAADELYLAAGTRLPSARHYDGFPQLGNGIGMTRKFLDEWAYVKRKLLGAANSADPAILPIRTTSCPRNKEAEALAGLPYPKAKLAVGGRVAVITGTLFAPTFQAIIDELNQFGVGAFDLIPVVSSFFGPTVTVAGLLTGADVLAALRRQPSFDRENLVLLPRNMLDVDGCRFLDGLMPADLARETGAQVAPARNLGEMISIAMRQFPIN